MHWAKRQRRPTLPAPHHLCGEKLFLAGARGVCLHELAERCHALVQLAKRDVGAVASQHVRLRHRREVAGLVAVAQEEFARFYGVLLRICPGNAAPFDCGMAYAVFKSERFPFGR